MKKIRFRVNGKWSGWDDYDLFKVPDGMDAVEVSEEMSLREIRENKHLHDLYLKQVEE